MINTIEAQVSNQLEKRLYLEHINNKLQESGESFARGEGRDAYEALDEIRDIIRSKRGV